MIVLRIVAQLSNNDEIVRQVEIAHEVPAEVPAEVAAEVAAEVPPFLNSFDNVCKHISSLRQEIEERDKEISSAHILQVIVQSQHLHEELSLKELLVVNMCGTRSYMQQPDKCTHQQPNLTSRKKKTTSVLQIQCTLASVIFTRAAAGLLRC